LFGGLGVFKLLTRQSDHEGHDGSSDHDRDG
jgi:hypothetical protein